jgi:hypothetical protein
VAGARERERLLSTALLAPAAMLGAIDEIFGKYLIPQMFAEVARGKRTPRDAAEVYDRSFKHIFSHRRSQGKL